jgi:hypothetical protein
MKSEMDILKMTERERLCWLKANRVTLLLVGITWISMIAQQLLEGALPLFLIIMIPVFGLFRALVYVYYKKKTPEGDMS